MNAMRISPISLLPLALLLTSTAFGCSDGDCGGSGHFEVMLACNGPTLPFLSPENDSRLNLLLLLDDKRKISLASLIDVATRLSSRDGADEKDSDTSDEQEATGIAHAKNDPPSILSQLNVDQELWQDATESSEAFERDGGRCISNTIASARHFINAVEEAVHPQTQAKALIEYRLRMFNECGAENDLLNYHVINTGLDTPAKKFEKYLYGARAFYIGNFAEAEKIFQSLSTSDQAWVQETSRYMLARVTLNQAQKDADGPWGAFKKENSNKELLSRTEKYLESYLKDYPHGLYSDSARGLFNRVYWLQGAENKLAESYAVAWRGINQINVASLVNEIDSKLLMENKSEVSYSEPDFLIAHILLWLRPPDSDYSTMGDGRKIPADGWKNMLARLPPDTAAYLSAADSYYLRKDYRAVLLRTDPNAFQKSGSLIRFSAQVLRGLSYMSLHDWAGAERQWRSLLAAEKDLRRSYFLQLKLAMTLEQADKLDAVFSDNSPITDPELRTDLLHIVPAELLRKDMRSANQSMPEKEEATRILLFKDLTHGFYQDFPQDVALSKRLGIKARTTLESDTNNCGAVTETASHMASNPHDAKGLNCLADYILSDEYSVDNVVLPRFNNPPDRFGGNKLSGLSFYRQAMSEDRSDDEQKSYALYSAINCFRQGFNHCGLEDVPVSERKRWFVMLKLQYRDTRWAKRQRIYW